jgi:hypothetical protein
MTGRNLGLVLTMADGNTGLVAPDFDSSNAPCHGHATCNLFFPLKDGLVQSMNPDDWVGKRAVSINSQLRKNYYSRDRRDEIERRKERGPNKKKVADKKKVVLCRALL